MCHSNRILLVLLTDYYLKLAFLSAIALTSFASANLLHQPQEQHFNNRTSVLISSSSSSSSSNQFKPTNAISSSSATKMKTDESRLDKRQIMPSQQSPKFSSTNELDVFLDDMNHNELRTVASGQPIGDFFRHTAKLGDEHIRHNQAAVSMNSNRKQQVIATSETGNREIYSECALILQRTFVKNMDDSK